MYPLLTNKAITLKRGDSQKTSPRVDFLTFDLLNKNFCESDTGPQPQLPYLGDQYRKWTSLLAIHESFVWRKMRVE
jgi:hypothetical protein